MFSRSFKRVGLHYTAFRNAIREDSRQTAPSRGVSPRKKFAVRANVESRVKNDERLSMYFDVDTDSAYVLDYAGPRLMKRPEFARECKALEGMNEWVLSLYKRYCFTGENEHDKVANPKLARRYVMWLDYLRLAEFYRTRNVQDT